MKFETYTSTDVYNVLGIDLYPKMTFSQVADMLDMEGINYFYISMDSDDVLEAMGNEPEIVKAISPRLIHIKELGIYLAIY